MFCDCPPIGLGKGKKGLVGEVTVLLLLLPLGSLKLGRLVELAAEGRRRRSQRLRVGWDDDACAWLLELAREAVPSSELELELCERLGLCLEPAILPEAQMRGVDCLRSSRGHAAGKVLVCWLGCNAGDIRRAYRC